VIAASAWPSQAAISAAGTDPRIKLTGMRDYNAPS
jgi:hypothetical protein